MKNLQITPMITNRDEDSLDIYLNNISKEKSITPEDEKELARRIHHGDKQALDKLVRANLRFVVSVAKKYQDQGMGLSDLISEGNIGLVKAAEAFDETMNVKFISYAVWWIRQSIMQALTDYSRQIRIPHNQDTLLRNVRRTFNRIEQRIAEAEKLGFTDMIIPKYNLKGLDPKKYHITLHPVRKVEEALRVIFG